MMEQVREGIEMKEFLLKPLEELPESTRQELLKGLQDVLEEGDALNLLGETLDQSSEGEYEHPCSQAISNLMDLLDRSKRSKEVKDSVVLLVSAMEALPEVNSLKDEGEVSLPESPPVSLEQDGELRWAADLLCASEKMLAELSDSLDQPPEVLLEVLALTVIGVHMLQPRE